MIIAVRHGSKFTVVCRPITGLLYTEEALSRSNKTDRDHRQNPPIRIIDSRGTESVEVIYTITVLRLLS